MSLSKYDTLWCMKKVLVSLSANSVASREFLTGVFNYINSGHNWHINFQQNPNDLTPQLLQSFAHDGLDGIITGINRATPGYQTMISLGIPLALNNFPAEQPPQDRQGRPPSQGAKEAKRRWRAGTVHRARSNKAKG